MELHQNDTKRLDDWKIHGAVAKKNLGQITSCSFKEDRKIIQEAFQGYVMDKVKSQASQPQ